MRIGHDLFGAGMLRGLAAVDPGCRFILDAAMIRDGPQVACRRGPAFAEQLREAAGPAGESAFPCFRISSRSGKFVGNDSTAVRIDRDRSVAGRESALVAVLSWTDPARYSDRGGHGSVRCVHAVRVYELARMVGLAAQRDRIAAGSALAAARRLHQPLGHRDVGLHVGRLRQLNQNPVQNGHRFVHDPERACAAETGELYPRGTVALRDVPGHVDPAEEEGRSFCVRTLQRG